MRLLRSLDLCLLLLILLKLPSGSSFLLNGKIRRSPNISIRRPSVVSSSSSTSSIEPVPVPVPLTVVIPAYNEVNRIGPTLASYSKYLLGSPHQSYFSSVQILVIDDGSTDGTTKWIESKRIKGVDCETLPTNQGKGAAVAFGVQQIKKDGLILVADADGSANIRCLEPMMEKLIQTIQEKRRSISNSKSPSFWSTPAIVVGIRGCASDADTTESSSKKTILLRSILRWGFRTTVQILLIGNDLSVSDTQCGFKLMTVAAAKPLYSSLNLQRWTHDVEVLFRASKTNVAVAEQPIEWQDKEGSKLVEGLGGVAGTSMTMLLQVLKMRVAYELGVWQ